MRYQFWGLDIMEYFKMIYNINENTIIVNVEGDSFYLKDIYPHIKDTILKNQAKATDLEKKIDEFMSFINILQDGDPEKEDPKPILDFAMKCFGDIEVKI